MSTNFGNGIEIGKDVLNNREIELLKNHKEIIAEADAVVKKMEEIRDGFDNLIQTVRTVGYTKNGGTKIDNETTNRMMLEIVKVRDDILDQIQKDMLPTL